MMVYIASSDSFPYFAVVTVSDGCANVVLGNPSYSGNPTIPGKKWIETPSVVHMDGSEYSANRFTTGSERIFSVTFLMQTLIRVK